MVHVGRSANSDGYDYLVVTSVTSSVAETPFEDRLTAAQLADAGIRCALRCVVGYAKISAASPDDVYAEMVEVVPTSRRRGVASRMYDAFERRIGLCLRPAPEQSGAGVALWSSRRSPEARAAECEREAADFDAVAATATDPCVRDRYARKATERRLAGRGPDRGEGPQVKRQEEGVTSFDARELVLSLEKWYDRSVATRRTARAARTGRPLRLDAWHCSSDGKIKYGAGGAFFSEGPAGEYGDAAVLVRLSFENPLVVGDKDDALAALSGKPVRARGLDADGDALTRAIAKQDAEIARAARRAGHDALVYLNPGSSLSEHEYVAVRKGRWRVRELRKT